MKAGFRVGHASFDFDDLPSGLFINGEWREGSAERINVYNPSTEALLQTVANATVEDGLAAVYAAARAAAGPTNHSRPTYYGDTCNRTPAAAPVPARRRQGVHPPGRRLGRCLHDQRYTAPPVGGAGAGLVAG